MQNIFENYVLKYLVLILLFYVNFNSYGQIKGLKIGDKLPDLVIENVINHKASNIKFSELKGKIIILDFWSTWCKGCIEAMPKFDLLQKKFGDQIFILPVTTQPKDVIVKFWKQNKILKNVLLPSVVDDTILNKYFTPFALPYEVWIDQEGIIIGNTNIQYLNEGNISKILNKKSVVLNSQIKKTNYNFSNPLFSSLLDTGLKEIIYYSAIRKHIDSVKGTSSIKIAMDKDGYSKVTFINQPLLKLYNAALMFIPHLNAARTIIEVRDSSKLVYNSKKHYKDVWDKENTYCYEAVMRGKTREEVFEQMCYDLNKHFQLYGRVEKRKMNCFLVKKIKGFKMPDTLKDGKKTYITTIHDLIKRLNLHQEIPPVIIDGTYPDFFVFAKKLPVFIDRRILQTLLSPIGYEIESIERELDVFILSDK